MKALWNRPVACGAIAFAVGVYAGAAGWLVSLAGPILILVAGLLISVFSRGRRRAAFPSVVLLFMGAGALFWIAHHAGPPGDPLSRHLAQHPVRECAVEGRVRWTTHVLPAENYSTFVLDVERFTADGTTIGMQGRMSVRWSNPSGPLLAGQHVRVVGRPSVAIGRVNPGISDAEDALRIQGVHSSLGARGSNALTYTGPASRASVRHWASRLRAFQARRFLEAVPESALPFVMAVWLGDRHDVSTDNYQAFVASGTAHILAVSGVHVGVFFVSIAFLLRLLIRNRKICSLLAMVAVVLFALTAGGRVSALRAALMVVVYLSADFFDRERDVPTALGISALLFLVWNPDMLLSKGFILSFLSVASILAFSEPLSTALSRLPGGIREGLSNGLAVQLLPLPMALRFFHVLPLAAPLANLVVIPLLATVLWLCFLTSVTASLSTDAAAVFGYALTPLVFAIQELAATVSSARWTHIALTSPSAPAVTCYWAVLGALTYSFTVSASRRIIAWAVAAGLAICMVILWRPLDTGAQAVFLDVGHGDATFIRTSGGSTVLIDGGDRNDYVEMGSRVVAPFLRSHGVSYLDCVVVSHPDRDHVGGLFHVLEQFPVGAVIMGPPNSNHPLETELLDLCTARNIPVRRVYRGDEIPVEGARLEVLHPPRDWPTGSSTNNRGLVVRLDWAGPRVLFTGDIEAEAETALAQGDCRADVLKVPHHGSPTSSTAPFISAVAPDYAVVSTGGTRGREPADPVVLGRYNASGIKVLRTDHLGGISMHVDGSTAVFEGARESRGYVVPRSGTASGQ